MEAQSVKNSANSGPQRRPGAGCGNLPVAGRIWSLTCSCWLLATMGAMPGCEVDSFFDPSRTGRFEHMPTTIPILERIDVIEQAEEPWARATAVTRDDLLPSDLTYRLAPGDVITVEIFELILQGEVWQSIRRIGASGFFRLPAPLGDVRAVGLTIQEFQDDVTRLVDELVIKDPMVNVQIEEGGAFRYTIYGASAGVGLYTLMRPDMGLLEALAQAGGVPAGTKRIYVIRQKALSRDVIFEPSPRRPAPAEDRPREPPDIEKLIRELEEQEARDVHPGLLRQEGEPVIDIDELEPLQQPPMPELVTAPPTLGPSPQPRQETDAVRQSGDVFIYDEQLEKWVRVPAEEPAGRVPQVERAPTEEEELIVERIIEVPYDKLREGDSTYNIIIRPGDRIYVPEAEVGVVYIDGEIARPGVYSLPVAGRLTLSRLIAAAGGAGPLAIPERVDLTRIVGEGREATLRLNLAAIRRKTEPDLYLRPDDHIIIGTSWIATPLAVVRNGLRATYGFGFLLDRNFGNDVFGPPPVRFIQQQ